MVQTRSARRTAAHARRGVQAGLMLAMLVLGSPALAQTWTAPRPGPELQAALKKAEAGDPAALTRLADGGDANAQYFAGVLYLFGGPKTVKDPARGCAYERKASARRADAMHLVALCYQNGGGAAPDRVKAEAAYRRAADMGFAKSKCALGQMLMSDPPQAPRGLALCQESAAAGDADAQVTVGNAYFNGSAGKRDLAAARKWYDLAAKQKKTDAARRLGEMYLKGDGGPKDAKKAMALWTAGEKAGDPLVAILVADHLFSKLTGGRTPGPGRYAFKGGVPVADIGVIEDWYRQALKRDPRPDVQKRAKYALAILASMKTAAPYGSTRS